MPKTLYAKLALFLLVLVAVIGSAYVLLTLYTTTRHIQEVNQELNRGLARHLVSEKILMRDGEVDETVLEDVFHMLMVINPNIELYLLGPQGEILAFSAPPGSVERDRVALEPVGRFLSGSELLPILGDDPRDWTRRKIFSVAPITDGAGAPAGYLYIVLASEEYDSAAEMLRQSYILRLSLGIAALGLLLVLAGTLVGFALLTRRLRSLAVSMETFRRRHLSPGGETAQEVSGRRGDEIDQLTVSFDQMARRIAAQMQELEEKETLRRELVANVSHDLRTPLATLHGYLETLSLKDRQLSPRERTEYLAAAIRHSERLGRLISELFDLAKMDAGEMRPREEPFSMAELVQDIVQEFQLQAAEKSVRMEVSPPADLPFVKADIGMLERVLENLVENAIRHTPGQGCVTVRLLPDAGQLRVEVEDTGSGIPPEDLPRIFDRFYKAGPDVDSTAGMGLGLAISKRILELHGRSIEARSVPGRGTTFSFGLPVAAAGPTP